MCFELDGVSRLSSSAEPCLEAINIFGRTTKTMQCYVLILSTHYRTPSRNLPNKYVTWLGKTSVSLHKGNGNCLMLQQYILCFDEWLWPCDTWNKQTAIRKAVLASDQAHFASIRAPQSVAELFHYYTSAAWYICLLTNAPNAIFFLPPLLNFSTALSANHSI